jgi:ribosomal-protein-alanine N-acetyltransferase
MGSHTRAATRPPVSDGSAGAPVLALREATAADLEAIEAIERRAFSDPWSRASFASLIGQALVHFVVATKDGQVIGYIVAWFIGGDGEIGNVAVDEGHRGQGIGHVLLEHALGSARARGVDVVYLEVRESNLEAQRLYARRGFVRVGRRRRYYRRPEEDALILRLELAPHESG